MTHSDEAQQVPGMSYKEAAQLAEKAGFKYSNFTELALWATCVEKDREIAKLHQRIKELEDELE